MKFSELKSRYPEYHRMIDRADRLIMSGERSAAELIEAADGWIARKIAPEHQEAAKAKFITFCSLRAQAKARAEEDKLPEPRLY